MQLIGNGEKCAQYWPSYTPSTSGTNVLSPNSSNPEPHKAFGPISVKTLGETLVEFDTYRRILQIIKTEPSEHIPRIIYSIICKI